MKKISLAKRSRIIDHVFAGNTYRETRKKENVSIGTISNIYEEFVEAAESSSIEEAGEKYGIRDKIERLLELAKETRRSKAPTKKLLSAARLYRFIQARNLKPSQLKKYLQMIDKYQNKFEDFASKAIEFYEIEERTGILYEKLVKDYPNLASKCQILRNELAELKKKIRRATKSLERELKNNKLTRSEIFYASWLKETLTKYNFTVQDTSKIPKFLQEIQECKGDPRTFLIRAEKTTTLNREIHGLESKKERLATTIEDLDNQKTLLKKEVNDLSKTKTEIENKTKKQQIKLNEQNEEIREKDLYIRVVNCLSEILLNRPADVDALYTYAWSLKDMKDKPTPDTIKFKPAHTEEVRRILVQALTEHFSKDLAPKEEVIKLKNELNKTTQKYKELTEQYEKLKHNYEQLNEKYKKLENYVKNLEEEARKSDERKLTDPSIPPDNRKPPFHVF